DAGAIIIAKTGLTELANWVAGNPNAMPGNYNAVGGFAFNPYDPRPDPRDNPGDGRPVLQTGGSTSGLGTAANFWGGDGGQRTRRVRDQPVQREHARRDPPDDRPHQPLRRDSDHRGPRHGRPDGAQRHGCRDHDGRARKPRSRSERSGERVPDRLYAAAQS